MIDKNAHKIIEEWQRTDKFINIVNCEPKYEIIIVNYQI